MRVGRSALLRVAVAIFMVVAIAVFAFTLVDAWHSTHGELLSVPRLTGAAGLWACALLAGAYAWARLLGGEHRTEHAASLLVSQLGKYVPGGVWQATGQVGLARAAGVRLQRGVTTFSVHAIAQAVAGCAYGLVLGAAWTRLAVPLRILMGVGALATLPLIDRRWMVWVLRRIPRTREMSGELVPAQREIVIAWAACIVSTAAMSGSYLLLLGSVGHVDQPLLVVGAYAIAWTAGFVAVPIPSGLGVREAVLAGILHGTFSSSVIVAASVSCRLVAVVTEGLLAAVASHKIRPSRLAAATGPVKEDDPAGTSESSGSPPAPPRQDAE